MSGRRSIRAKLFSTRWGAAGDLASDARSIRRTERVAQLLQQVGLPAGSDAALSAPVFRRPAPAFALPALALNLKVHHRRAPVSALDVSVQAQVLTLLEDLRQRYRLSYLFISHDMVVVERICCTVVVMFGGQLVEIGPRDRMLYHPQHPILKHLLSAVLYLTFSKDGNPSHQRNADKTRTDQTHRLSESTAALYRFWRRAPRRLLNKSIQTGGFPPVATLLPHNSTRGQ